MQCQNAIQINSHGTSYEYFKQTHLKNQRQKRSAIKKKSGIAWKHEVKKHVSVVAPECHAYKRHVPGDNIHIIIHAKTCRIFFPSSITCVFQRIVSQPDADTHTHRRRQRNQKQTQSRNQWVQSSDAELWEITVDTTLNIIRNNKQTAMGSKKV